MAKDALASIFAQTCKDYELIIVDDGSTEHMCELFHWAEERGGSVILSEHKGVAAARNIGAAQAKGSWLCFLDSDDIWLPKKLETQLAFVAGNPSCRILQTEERWIRQGHFANPKKRHKKPSGEAFERSLELCCISPSAVMIDKELFIQNHGFDEHMRVCEDYDLWLRLTAKHHVGLIDKPLIEKRGGHEDQLSRSEPAMNRFRVYAMAKLLVREALSQDQIKLVLAETGRKCSVIVKGARKRGNKDWENLYGEVGDASALALEELTQHLLDISSKFSHFLLPLQRDILKLHLQ